MMISKPTFREGTLLQIGWAHTYTAFLAATDHPVIPQFGGRDENDDSVRTTGNVRSKTGRGGGLAQVVKKTPRITAGRFAYLRNIKSYLQCLSCRVHADDVPPAMITVKEINYFFRF